MPFTRTNRPRGGGRRDKFGNENKNVFCKETQSKNGTVGYKGFFEINGRLYAIYFANNNSLDKKGNCGVWASITEYSQSVNRW